MTKEPSFTVSDMPREERPRERLQRFGVEALSAQELLALLIGRGVPRRSVLDIAQELMSKFGSIRAISDAAIEELSQVKGVGTAKAAQLKACFELGRRQELETDYEFYGVHIKNPQGIAKIVRASIRDRKKEHFIIIPLSTRNKKIGKPYPITVSTGTLNASLVHPREVFKEAIVRSASSVVLAHNHPSGDPEPSGEDLKITGRLVEAGKIVGIEILDHIIIGKNSYCSFKERGLI